MVMWPVLEALMGLAAGRGPRRIMSGPKDAALREAQVCYKHLAGSLGRAFLTRMEELGWVSRDEGARSLSFSEKGKAAFEAAFPMHL